MKEVCLAIESSCDETAVAILARNSGKIQILSEAVSSQTALHEAYGGVVPELASREHLTNLPLLVDRAVSESGIQFKDLSCLAVTQGPGLKGCLLIGLEFAKGVSISTGLPLIGVNHIEGHILSPWIIQDGPIFPYLALVVSGGHTEIVKVSGVGKYSVLARTGDDAAGEAFDKAANLLGFTYPGGAKLAQLADSAPPPPKQTRFQLPKVMREAEGFSFSGLKTAISNLINKHRDEIDGSADVKREICWAVQNSIVDSLINKLQNAIRDTGIRTVAVVGGVSANRELRSRITALPGVKVLFSEKQHCTDNAAMIALVGILRHELGEKGALTLEVKPRWSVEEISI